jgi:hypothetical protein
MQAANGNASAHTKTGFRMAAILSALLIILTGATAAIASSTSANNALSDDGEVDLAPRGQNQKSWLGSTPGKTPTNTPTNTPAKNPGMGLWTPGSTTLSSNCATSWNYDRCTDILDLGSIFVFNLSVECVEPHLEHASELEGVVRGEHLAMAQTSASLIWFLLVCGEGDYVVVGIGMTDADFYEDVTFVYDTAMDVYDVAKGANPAGAILGAVYDAATAEDYRFGDHDNDGVWNVNDPDYTGPMSSADNVFTRWWTQAASDWLDDHPAESDDDDDDDDDDNNDDEEDDEETTSLHDGDGCPDEGALRPVLC